MPIGNLEKLVPNFFVKQKYQDFKTRIKTKKDTSQWRKQYVDFNAQKRIEAEKKTETKMETRCIS